MNKIWLYLKEITCVYSLKDDKIFTLEVFKPIGERYSYKQFSFLLSQASLKFHITFFAVVVHRCFVILNDYMVPEQEDL